jgi:integrase
LAVLCGLRISEVAGARKQDLTYEQPTTRFPGGWQLSVLGKFDKVRKVPIPDLVMDDLRAHLSDRNLSVNLDDLEAGTFLVGCIPSHLKRMKFKDDTAPAKVAADGVTHFAIHRALKKLFERAALRANPSNAEAAQKLFEASAHWLRHTFGTDAVEVGVPLEVVRDVLGHSSLTTTSIYVHTSLGRRRAELSKYWTQPVPEVPQSS